MQKRKFTAVTQLHEKNNHDIIEYIESSRSEYAKAVRETFYMIRNKNFNKSQHNTYLQHKYGIVKRTANSIISDAQGHFNKLKGLTEYKIKQLECKITYLESVIIPKLVEKRNYYSMMIQTGSSNLLIKQRNLRLKIVAKKAKLNKLKQKLCNLNYQLHSNRLKFCFGTKQLLKRDYGCFIEKRDNQMAFVGSKSEQSCNQILQLTYNRKDNQFLIQLRKDFGGHKSCKGEDKYAYGKVCFNNHKEYIISILRYKTSPLSYKIIKKNNRYYFYCIFEIQLDNCGFVTCSHDGTIGLDFNKGFITLSETNKYGHLNRIQVLPYRFKSGNKTKHDLQLIANYVMKLAIQTGKDVCIEDLEFEVKKSKTESKQRKRYNDMIHSLPYRMFINIIENSTYRNKVNLIKVHPSWTSWLAKQIYCPTMKLNVHVGASYVIARRGQGYKEILK